VPLFVTPDLFRRLPFRLERSLIRHWRIRDVFIHFLTFWIKTNGWLFAAVLLGGEETQQQTTTHSMDEFLLFVSRFLRSTRTSFEARLGAEGSSLLDLQL